MPLSDFGSSDEEYKNTDEDDENILLIDLHAKCWSILSSAKSWSVNNWQIGEYFKKFIKIILCWKVSAIDWKTFLKALHYHILSSKMRNSGRSTIGHSCQMLFFRHFLKCMKTNLWVRFKRSFSCMLETRDESTQNIQKKKLICT